VALAPILLGRAFYTRFDAVPAALAAAALACSARRRDIPSGVLLGLAAAVKIYPLVLLPLFVLKALGERGRRGAVAVAGGFAAALAIVAGPFAVLGAGGVRFSVHVQATRRTALESLTGAALLAADKLGWYAARIHEGLTFELAGSPASVLGATESVVLALVVVSVWAMFWRSQRRDPELVTACAAAVAATIVFHKVLSPQYLIWAVPLVALVAGRLGMLSRVLLAGAMILTAAYFPHRYRELRFGGGAVWILLARNVLLLALAAVLVGAVFRASASRPSRPCRSSRRGRAASAAG
jgi:uncharacterized membrane protein